MKVCIINKKGGVGKTPFAFSIAKDLKLFLQSNDNSMIEKIYPKMAKISKEVKNIDNCVYDFGGFVDKGVIEILKTSDFNILPCLPNYNSILRTVETINEIAIYNKNIIVLITGIKNTEDEIQIKEAIIDKFSNMPILFFSFKESKILENSILTGLSMEELYNENGLSRNNYKGFYLSYKSLLNVLKNAKKC
ncbi:MAG: hypothetical protein LBP57_00080 [Endomicrobium sp.]|jgi:cellulose biosynthesis protein BcsQ|nr:hypothetical protein [Endomicrobium sp.]